MEKLTNEVVGQTGELAAALYFSKRGCVITWPRSSKNPGFDFLAEKAGKITRVQVKAGNSFIKGRPFVGATVDSSKCDVVYIYHLATNAHRLYPAGKCPTTVHFPRKEKHEFDVEL
jgi:hypothetical protein